MFYSLPPVFALHFVEGLPNNDVSTYTFNFKGRNYSVTTVIQYKSHLKHFVTWTCSADGTYLCVACEQTTELFNVVQIREYRMLKLRNIYIFIYLKICQFQMNRKHFKNGRTGNVYHYVASALLLTTVVFPFSLDFRCSVDAVYRLVVFF